MRIRDKLYKKENKTVCKTVNVDDVLYDKLRELSAKVYDAKISEIINVAIEEYIDRNNPTFYGKTELETVTYRNLMLRKDNIAKLKQYQSQTGIPFTRLVNGAIKEFLDNNN